MRVDAHRLPRAGATDEEYEDAHAGPLRSDDSTRVAVADGATESAYAREWAGLLCESVCRVRSPDRAIEQARERFWEMRGEVPASAPWYAHAKAEEGAHAAFLSLEIRDDGNWSAAAVGDCVLFIVTGNEIQTSWPIDDPAAFDNRPDLVGSTVDSSIPNILTRSGELGKGKGEGASILLCTDALAAHLLSLEELDLKAMRKSFEEWVETARKAGMRNDDITMIEVRR